MLTIQTAYLFIYLLSNYYVPRTKLAAENPKLLDVRIRFQINEKKKNTWDYKMKQSY